MNDRFYRVLGLSLVIHLLLLFLFPPPRFEQPDPLKEKTLRVSLLKERRERPKRTENNQPAETHQNIEITEESKSEDQPTNPSKNGKTDENTKSQAAPDKRTREKNNIPEEETNQDQRSQSKEQQKKSSDKPNRRSDPEGKIEPVDDQPARDVDDGLENSLLQRGTSFGNASTINQNREEKPQETSPPVTSDIRRYEVLETSTTRLTRSSTVRINTPEQPKTEPKTVEIPTYTVTREPRDSTVPSDTPEAYYQSPDLPYGGRKILHQPLPAVPDWLEKSGEEVKVIVRYRIEASGEISSVSVVKSSGYPKLDGQVIRKLEQWRFEPENSAERRMTVFQFVLK